MKPRIYVETTIPSYLTAWPSRDLIIAAHQQITREWWLHRKSDIDLFVSQPVIEECQAGDPEASARRLGAIEGLALLEQTRGAVDLARGLVDRIPLPDRAKIDALRVALAVVHGMDDLLTWNCTHIANAVLRPRIESVCRTFSYEPPVICTPEELLPGEAL